MKFMTWPIHGPDPVVRPAVDAPAKERTGQGREGFDELKDAMYGMVNAPLVRLPSPAAFLASSADSLEWPDSRRCPG